MTEADLTGARLGWIGVGRMGAALLGRLFDHGCDVAVFNRTRAKTEPFAERGATIVDAPADLADRDIVFTMVAGSGDFEEVVLGSSGVLAGGAPGILVDSSTVSPTASMAVRAAAHERGTALLAAPVSGNPKVVAAGQATLVASGPEDAFRTAQPYLALLGAGVTYVGDGEGARLVKICHNLFLGVVAESLAEISVLAEKGGVARADFLEFLNGSVMGSPFTRYKTPALVNLEFSPTFTPALLLKDFDLGLDAAREVGVPMPVAALVRQTVQSLIGNGYGDADFAALLMLQASASALTLTPDRRAMDDGLAAASGRS